MKKEVNDWAKYSAMGFQMMGAILIGVFGGQWLDTQVAMDFPLFTLIGSMLGVGSALYFIIRTTKQ